MGTAIFWDLAVASGEWDLKNAYNPRNVLPIMVGPLAGTGVPGAGRTSVCGLSPETFPTCEFWRSNLGGRFGNMMKLAGWDGVVVEGKADKPVWISIINDQVKIENGKWRSDQAPDMYLDRKGVDDFKSHYYALEGWDKEHGWPTQKTLEKLGLKRMIKTLRDSGKLGTG